MSEPSTEANKKWWNLPVSKLSLKKHILLREMSCQNVVDFFKSSNHIQQLLVTDAKETKVLGVIALDTLLSHLISGTVNGTDLAEKIMTKQFMKVTASMTIGKVSRILEKEPYAVVVDDHDALIGLVSRSEIFDFITKDDDGKEIMA